MRLTLTNRELPGMSFTYRQCLNIFLVRKFPSHSDMLMIHYCISRHLASEDEKTTFLKSANSAVSSKIF